MQGQALAATAVSATEQQAGMEPGSTSTSTSRYYYRQGKRVLAQEGILDAADLKTHTRQARYEGASHRWLADDKTQAPAQYNANGQPRQIGRREYVWDALGRLVEVRQEDKSLASYSYNHRSERIGKTTSQAAPGQTTRYLYEDGQVSAELNEQGQITRQYLYLAGQGIAVIDTPQGQPLSNEELPAHVLLGLDAQNILKHLWHSLAGSDGNEQTAWLHVNHLGAPEAATDSEGQLIWQASYAPFGAAKIIKASAGKSNDSSQFTLNLRLPGQYFDAETGLFYNKHRYYDPARGEYLTPDPLGAPDGPNGYSYVRYNPLKYVDPDGLILFAFDGTGNSDNPSDPAMANNGSSNVKRFYDAYDEASNGKKYYVSGVGTVHQDLYGYGDIRPDDYVGPTNLLYYLTPGDPKYLNDMGGNYSGAARIDRMMQYMERESQNTPDEKIMQIDIVGFSRGAAQAREFSNRLVNQTKEGRYRYEAVEGGKVVVKYQCVNFRFMGLWDTVLSTNYSGLTYRLGIPDAFARVSQAVALNEYRGGDYQLIGKGIWDYRNPKASKQHFGAFPLESIGASSNQSGKIRSEMGFIGAHADIGGGYADGDNELSSVALNWIQRQAIDSGIKLQSAAPIAVGNSVIHDQSMAIRVGNPTTSLVQGSRGASFEGIQIRDGRTIGSVKTEDRQVNGAVRGNSARTMGFNNGSMVNADTHQFIDYTARPGQGQAFDDPQIRALKNKTGTVDVTAYAAWLRSHGYCFVGDTQGSCAVK